MGIAAYNRGSAAISRQIQAERRPIEFEMMDRLNEIQNDFDAGTPWGRVELVFGHGGVWISCVKTGFGWWYPDIRTIMKRWRIRIFSYDCGRWIADPKGA